MSGHAGVGDGWRKSSSSDPNECVEVRFAGSSIFVRDSKDPDGPALVFTIGEWAAFVTGVRDGEFDTSPAP